MSSVATASSGNVTVDSGSSSVVSQKVFTNKCLSIVLDDNNFLLWKQQVLLAIRSRRLKKLLTGAVAPPLATVTLEDVGDDIAVKVWATVNKYFTSKLTSPVMNLYYQLKALQKEILNFERFDNLRINANVTRVKDATDSGRAFTKRSNSTGGRSASSGGHASASRSYSTERTLMVHMCHYTPGHGFLFTGHSSARSSASVEHEHNKPRAHIVNGSSSSRFIDFGATHHVTPNATEVVDGEDYNGLASKLARDNQVFFEFHTRHFVVRDENIGVILLQGREVMVFMSLVHRLQKRAEAKVVYGDSIEYVRWHDRLSHPSFEVLKQVCDHYTHTRPGFQITVRKRDSAREIAVSLPSELPTTPAITPATATIMFGLPYYVLYWLCVTCQDICHPVPSPLMATTYWGSEIRHPGHRGNQCLDPEGKIYVSCHVEFDEHIFLFYQGDKSSNSGCAPARYNNNNYLIYVVPGAYQVCTCMTNSSCVRGCMQQNPIRSFTQDLVAHLETENGLGNNSHGASNDYGSHSPNENVAMIDALNRDNAMQHNVLVKKPEGLPNLTEVDSGKRTASTDCVEEASSNQNRHHMITVSKTRSYHFQTCLDNIEEWVSRHNQIIKESKDLSAFSLDKFMGSLQSHDARTNRSFEKDEEQVFQLKREMPEMTADKGRGRGGVRGRGRGQSGQRDRGKNGECSNHMTGVRSMFKELNESYKIKVRLGDNKQIQTCQN
ncbi:hypothetical protein F3Y22_tig00110684pilonHSYRG00021 [Hibiscus syriacus]|uniref:Uncharacterized protein n=1 Tax=Hibiscus syriacus TaxID=106335 RepID=A0A6A2ZV09_HIBSY|nr:hypothetical protein F3Y22_tig00110684pilonHSYRG00021 [Hibiscus syriacus]